LLARPRTNDSYSFRLPPDGFGMSIALPLAMTDENYTALLLWTICVLTFACGVVALTQHPEWFGA
jgi:hypothetical protein